MSGGRRWTPSTSSSPPSAPGSQRSCTSVGKPTSYPPDLRSSSPTPSNWSRSPYRSWDVSWRRSTFTSSHTSPTRRKETNCPRRFGPTATGRSAQDLAHVRTARPPAQAAPNASEASPPADRAALTARTPQGVT
ncbi:hypothetical protein FJT64_023698 [Amphibalanus amphitrite]|uniref:Uncharacterized protein n=1 Tax=Amphibalanus amphitrite TaxID=1232801 RepID=A0A6A4WPC8_AMPAM|nr:hypothetical protein FJT64_023698 [Amphibalanus amphitrite]